MCPLSPLSLVADSGLVYFETTSRTNNTSHSKIEIHSFFRSIFVCWLLRIKAEFLHNNLHIYSSNQKATYKSFHHHRTATWILHSSDDSDSAGSKKRTNYFVNIFSQNTENTTIKMWSTQHSCVSCVLLLV